MVTTATNGKIQRTEPAAAAIQKAPVGDSVADLLRRMEPEMKRALPKHLTAERMARVALTAVRMNRDLALCSQASLAACIMTAAQLGLEPNTPLQHSYLIPRNSKEGKQCTILIGYQGLLELARRSGAVEKIWAYPVYDGDDFHVEYGLHPTLRHVPCGEEHDSKLTHVYACAKLKDSPEPIFVVVTRKQIEATRARSASGSSGPWKTDLVPMALKTGIRRLMKWVPQSLEMASVISAEEAAERGESQSAALAPIVGDAVERLDYSMPDATGLLDDDSVATTEGEAQ